MNSLNTYSLLCFLCAVCCVLCCVLCVSCVLCCLLRIICVLHVHCVVLCVTCVLCVEHCITSWLYGTCCVSVVVCIWVCAGCVVFYAVCCLLHVVCDNMVYYGAGLYFIFRFYNWINSLFFGVQLFDNYLCGNSYHHILARPDEHKEHSTFVHINITLYFFTTKSQILLSNNITYLPHFKRFRMSKVMMSRAFARSRISQQMMRVFLTISTQQMQMLSSLKKKLSTKTWRCIISWKKDKIKFNDISSNYIKKITKVTIWSNLI